MSKLRLPTRRTGRAAFAFIFITVALDMLALGIMVPVLPKLIIAFEGGSFTRAATIVGYFGAAWALMQFVCAPVLGALSDRFGRRPVVLLSNVGLGLDYVVMAVAPTAAWLFLGRVISGITSSSFPTASAYVADVTPPEQRAARFGMLSAAFGLGFVVGPAVGGILGAINLRLPFWVAAGLSGANAAYGYFILPESLPPERRGRVAWRMANPVGSLALLRARTLLLGFASAAFLYYVAHEALPSLYVLYTDYRYDWNERQIGLSLALVGVCATIVSAALVGPVVARFGERRGLLSGLAFFGAGLAVLGWAPSGAWVYIGIPLLSLGGLADPSMQALTSRRVDATEQGRLQGAFGSLRGIAMIVGPWMFTQIFAASLRAGGGRLSGMPMYLSAVLLLTSVGIAYYVTGLDLIHTPAAAFSRDRGLRAESSPSGELMPDA